MRSQDLELSELLELDPVAGLIRFAGRRAFLLDAVAAGLLRKYLADNFGLVASRALLTRSGFAHGWQMAESVRTEFHWEDPTEWRRAGPRFHELQGLFQVAPDRRDPLAEEGMEVINSYEAEQHLLHFGPSDAPACWTLTGMLSGFLSRTLGKDIYVVERACVARGDPRCHFVGRTSDQWRESDADELKFFHAQGAFDGVEESLARVAAGLKAAEEEVARQRRELEQSSQDAEPPPGLVIKSRAMRRLVALARRVSKVDTSVLVSGESGVGKERIARLIHQESMRSGGPFVAVNCGAVTETLLESELFGHVRGAFTGAEADRQGLFEAANHGTLLLDEIGDVSRALQLKLLRALQERELRRVGENVTRPFDVRVVAASNRDLAAEVASGAFRQDLYYRLNVVVLHVPALRERVDDVLPLARMFLAEAAQAMKRPKSGITPAAADLLLRHPWPGNVRELQNAMQRAVALAPGEVVDAVDLPDEVRLGAPLVSPPATAVRPLDEIERDYILAALALNGGNQAVTARQLEIGSATLYRKLKRFAQGRG